MKEARTKSKIQSDLVNAKTVCPVLSYTTINILILKMQAIEME